MIYAVKLTRGFWGSKSRLPYIFTTKLEAKWNAEFALQKKKYKIIPIVIIEKPSRRIK